LRFSHTPQVYDLAHFFLVHNSEFISEYQRIAAESRGRIVQAIEPETFGESQRVRQPGLEGATATHRRNNCSTKPANSPGLTLR